MKRILLLFLVIVSLDVYSQKGKYAWDGDIVKAVVPFSQNDLRTKGKQRAKFQMVYIPSKKIIEIIEGDERVFLEEVERVGDTLIGRFAIKRQTPMWKITMTPEYIYVEQNYPFQVYKYYYKGEASNYWFTPLE